jgi:virulence-associated protein VapD
MKNTRKESWESLEFYVKTAKQVIAMDADMSSMTVDYLESLRSERGHVHAIINNYAPTPRKILAYSNDGNQPSPDWLQGLIKALKDGKNAVVPTNSKSVTEPLLAQIFLEVNGEPPVQDLRADQVLLLTSDSDDQDKGMVGKASSYWSQYRLVVYTPTIGPGVDVNIPGWCDVVYAFATDRSSTAREFDQSIGRVRDIKSNEIHISLPRRRNELKLPTDTESVQRHIGNIYGTLVASGRRMMLDEMIRYRMKIDMRTHTWVLPSDTYTQAYLQRKVEVNRSRQAFGDVIKQRWVDRGYTVITKSRSALSDKQLEQHRAQMQEMKDAADEISAEDLVNARILTANEQKDAISRVKAGKATVADKRALERHDICTTFCVVPERLTVEFVQDFRGKHVMTRFSRYLQAIKPIGALMHHEKFQNTQGTSLFHDDAENSMATKRMIIDKMLQTAGWNDISDSRAVELHDMETRLTSPAADWLKDGERGERFIRAVFEIANSKAKDQFERLNNLLRATLDHVGIKMKRKRYRKSIGSAAGLKRQRLERSEYTLDHGDFLEFAYVRAVLNGGQCVPSQDQLRSMVLGFRKPFKYTSLHGVEAPVSAVS